MGQVKGRYTFFGHLKWVPVILLGYATSILTHTWINSASFHLPPSRVDKGISGFFATPPAGARHRRPHAPGQLHQDVYCARQVPRRWPE